MLAGIFNLRLITGPFLNSTRNVWTLILNSLALTLKNGTSTPLTGNIRWSRGAASSRSCIFWVKLCPGKKRWNWVREHESSVERMTSHEDKIELQCWVRSLKWDQKAVSDATIQGLNSRRNDNTTHWNCKASVLKRSARTSKKHNLKLLHKRHWKRG